MFRRARISGGNLARAGTGGPIGRLRAILARRSVLDGLLLLACGASWAAASPRSHSKLGVVLAVWHGIWPTVRVTSREPIGTHFGTITPYIGLTIDQIELAGVPSGRSICRYWRPRPLKDRRAAHPRKCCTTPCRRFSPPGRFADIQAEADRTETTGVRLRFLTVTNFFVGMVTMEGVSINPSPNQLASATRLQLGELYTQEKLDRALAGIQRIMEENGLPPSQK